jgi:hypothetical protein
MYGALLSLRRDCVLTVFVMHVDVCNGLDMHMVHAIEYAYAYGCVHVTVYTCNQLRMKMARKSTKVPAEAWETTPANA